MDIRVIVIISNLTKLLGVGEIILKDMGETDNKTHRLADDVHIPWYASRYYIFSINASLYR